MTDKSQSGRPTHSARAATATAAPVQNVIGRGDETIGGCFKSRNVLGCRLLSVTSHLHSRANVPIVNKRVYYISAFATAKVILHVKQRCLCKNRLSSFCVIMLTNK